MKNCQRLRPKKKKWEKELESKSSLLIYMKHKTEIKEENCFENKPSFIIYFRSRANIVALEDIKRVNN